jgi:ribA/ribD-fused uncharacterized protein
VITRFSGDYAFLSNFWHEWVEYDGIAFPTAEHAFQAAKSLDPNVRHRVATASSPGEAKREGRRLTLRADWEAVKIPVMASILTVKFKKDSDLAALLLETGRHMLVEGNTWGDRFWGQVDGAGQNWLGRLLMLQRATLRAR